MHQVATARTLGAPIRLIESPVIKLLNQTQIGFGKCRWGGEQTNYVKIKIPDTFIGGLKRSILRMPKTTKTQYIYIYNYRIIDIAEILSEWLSSMRIFNEYQGVFFHARTITHKYRISHMCLHVFTWFAVHNLQLTTTQII